MQRTKNHRTSVLDRPLFGAVSLNWEVALYALLVLITIWTRFWHLGSRALHHDESLHAVYSWYLYVGRGYIHDPLMHGPFLFHITALMYWLFGDSNFTARLAPAIFGVLFTVSPIFLRRWLGRAGALFAAFMLTISPGFMYFSRMLRHDIFAAFFMLWMVIALFQFLHTREDRWLYLGAIALGLEITTKEIYYINGFIGVTFLLLVLGIEAARKSGPQPVTKALRSLTIQKITVALVIVAVIFTLFYTTFFTNVLGLVSGTVGALSYWLKQHGVRRGEQPWYYYLILIPLYEFLPLLFSLVGVAIFGKRTLRGETVDEEEPFVSFLIWWAAGTFIIYSWAGEKMPWLIIHITLPLILLAARTLGDLFDQTDWSAARDRGGLILAIVLPPTLFVLVTWSGLRPFQGQSLQKLGQTVQWIAALAVLIALLYAVIYYMRRLGRTLSIQVITFTAFALLSVATFRYAWIASFVHGDIAKDMLIYTQTTPDVTMVMQEIDALSERLAGDETMKVAYDNETSWPFEWYLRNYKNRIFFGATPGPNITQAPVILVGLVNDGKVKPYVTDYIRHHYKLRWWFPEDYKGMTVSKAWQYLQDPEKRASLRRFLLYRELDKPLGSTDFVMYVRKDVVSKVWQYGAAVAAVQPELAEDPYAKVLVKANAVAIWGSKGAGPGQFVNPRGLTVGPDGNIYVADSGNNRVVVLDSTGKFLRTFGTEGNAPGQFKGPWGISVDKQGNVYVADTWNHRIEKFDANGKFVKAWGGFADTGGKATGQPGLFWGPRSIAMDADGNLYVTDTGNKRIQKFDRDGNFLGQWGGFGIEKGQFNEPVGIAISSQTGDIFVADTWNHRVQRFDKDFNFIAEWPVHGWEGESVNNKPYIAVDSHDNVYVTDPEGYRVIAFDHAGNVKAVLGKFGSDAGSFNLPIGIAVDGQDNLYVSDSLNSRVMKFAPLLASQAK